MMGWYPEGIAWSGWVVMCLAMVAFWALVIVAVVALFRSDRGELTGSHESQDPIDILNQRFARGEIEEGEYRARANLLRAPADTR